MKAPFQVILLRALAFLACAFLLSTILYGPSEPFTPGAALPPALPPGGNSSAASDNSTSQAEGWQQLLGLLPEHATEKLHEAWAFGQNHQTGIVAVGLLTCLLAMLLAGRIRCVGGLGTGWAEVQMTVTLTWLLLAAAGLCGWAQSPHTCLKSE